MADKLLVGTLSSDAITVGWELLAQCDAAKYPVTDAFWRFAEDSRDWLLYLATPIRDEQGIRSTISQLLDILDRMTEEKRGGLMLSDIAPLSPRSPAVAVMRQRYGTVLGGRGRLVRRLSLSLDEPFIYRLNYPVEPVEQTVGAVRAAHAAGLSPAQGNGTHG